MTATADTIAIACDEPARMPLAKSLATRLNLPLATGEEHHDVLLAVTPERLELRQTGSQAPGPLFVDFSSGKLRYRMRFGGGRKQPLARAVGLKANRCPMVVDATAGLGRDGFILASLGCTVHLLERSPIVAALLADGLKRASQVPELQDIISRMHLTVTDSTTLPGLSPLPDVIYLDPMYPHRTKSALVKKEMRLVRRLVGEDNDAPALLSWALSHPGVRVVVKRPKGAAALGKQKPSMVIQSKNSRYDVYLT